MLKVIKGHACQNESCPQASDRIYMTIQGNLTTALLSDTTRETRIQALQYKMIHYTIAFNQWLNRIKIKESETCFYCNQIDNIPHFFINCEQTKAFWKTWGLWWKRLTNFKIRQQYDIIECILFGFPGNTNNIIIINYCIISANILFTRKK